jgi:hypothetical protein
MGWCLECHRDPTPYLRPREAVFAMGRTGHGRVLPEEERAFHRLDIRRLTSCDACHR